MSRGELDAEATEILESRIFPLCDCRHWRMPERYVRTDSGAYPARASDCDIEVFSSAVPDREYEEIGIVEGEGSAWKADLEDVLPKLKEEGCRAGGDALIMESSDTFSQGRDGIRTQRISATVIRWKTE